MSRSICQRGGVLALIAAGVLVVVALSVQASQIVPAAGATQSRSVVSAADDATRVDLPAGGSEARYRAQEVLAGRGFNEAVGRTSDVTGSLLLDASGAVLPDRSKISVDLRSLRSDSTMRDNYIRRSTLQSDRYPTADFVVGAANGLPSPLPTSGDATFELAGDLMVHGVTRPATWQVTATFAGGDVTGVAATDVRITDFGMEPPRAGPVLSIEDALRLEIEFRASVLPAVSLAD
jgi:polyisoprenoid-binding protein YceI